MCELASAWIVEVFAADCIIHFLKNHRRMKRKRIIERVSWKDEREVIKGRRTLDLSGLLAVEISVKTLTVLRLRSAFMFMSERSPLNLGSSEIANCFGW